MQFKYNYLTNRLWRIKKTEPDRLYEISEENKFPANFGGEGLVLGDSQWITFTLYSNRIKVFAKQVDKGTTIYYRKEIAIIPANRLPLVIPQPYREITFEFTAADVVIKNEKGGWVPKKDSG